MTLSERIRLFSLSTILFFGIDLVWLGLVADGFYDQHLGHLLRETVIWPAAVVFYLLFVAGIVVFVSTPAVLHRSPAQALVRGAFFGLVTYATFDLTSLALIDGFPLVVVIVDLAWGAFISAAVAGGGTFVAIRLSRRNAAR